MITGDIDGIFELACPVAELLWIDDWHFDLVYSESGRNETGCVFLEPSSGLAALLKPGASTAWYSTLFDEEKHLFEAVWLTEDLTIARWRLSMMELGGGRTRVSWSLTYTGLGPAGDRILGRDGVEERMTSVLEFLATSLRHYVERGSIYRVPHRRKARLVASLLGASLGEHFRRLSP